MNANGTCPSAIFRQMSRSTVVLPDPGLPSTRTEAARSGLSDVTEERGGGQCLRVVVGKGERIHGN